MLGRGVTITLGEGRNGAVAASVDTGRVDSSVTLARVEARSVVSGHDPLATHHAAATKRESVEYVEMKDEETHS